MEKQCKHCNQSFDIFDKPKGWMANHSRWCMQNPKRKEYDERLSKVRESWKNDNNLIDIRNQSIKNAWRAGKYAEIDFGNGFRGKHHSDETRKILQEKALASNHRRLKRSTIQYNDTLLDSSWELELAKRLDHLGIKWNRPNPIKWTDKNGLVRNYFPDFYLPDYDLYLDPKNPEAMRVQSEKIKILNNTYSNIIWISTLEECKTFNV